MFTHKYTYALMHTHTHARTVFEQLAVLNISGCIFALLTNCSQMRDGPEVRTRATLLVFSEPGQVCELLGAPAWPGVPAVTGHTRQDSGPQNITRGTRSSLSFRNTHVVNTVPPGIREEAISRKCAFLVLHP